MASTDRKNVNGYNQRDIEQNLSFATSLEAINFMKDIKKKRIRGFGYHIIMVPQNEFNVQQPKQTVNADGIVA
jgi:hypothetical protein